MAENVLYIFLDEGGNLDFSERGTKCFSLTGIVLKRPFEVCAAIKNYKYDLIEYGLDIEYFHASEDNKYIKHRIFDIISQYSNDIDIYSVIFDKSDAKNAGVNKGNITSFYSIGIASLLEKMEARIVTGIDKTIIITDQIPIVSKRKEIVHSIKKFLPEKIKASKYQILHHSSKSHTGLQVADYCNWAIFRVHERAGTQTKEDMERFLKISRLMQGVYKYSYELLGEEVFRKKLAEVVS
jgi:hypothetical protein